jgi:hypothetical protein
MSSSFASYLLQSVHLCKTTPATVGGILISQCKLLWMSIKSFVLIRTMDREDSAALLAHPLAGCPRGRDVFHLPPPSLGQSQGYACPRWYLLKLILMVTPWAASSEQLHLKNGCISHTCHGQRTIVRGLSVLAPFCISVVLQRLLPQHSPCAGRDRMMWKPSFNPSLVWEWDWLGPSQGWQSTWLTSCLLWFSCLLSPWQSELCSSWRWPASLGGLWGSSLDWVEADIKAHLLRIVVWNFPQYRSLSGEHWSVGWSSGGNNCVSKGK